MGSGGRNERLRILVVDPDVETQNLLHSVIATTGYLCETVSDADSALDRLAREKYDILFMDVFLPKLTGEDLLLSARALPNKPQVIIISLEDSEEVIQRLLRLGADAYYKKPLMAQQVRRAIAEAIGRMEIKERHAGSQVFTASCKKFIANVLSTSLGKNEESRAFSQ